MDTKGKMNSFLRILLKHIMIKINIINKMSSYHKSHKLHIKKVIILEIKAEKNFKRATKGEIIINKATVNLIRILIITIKVLIFINILDDQKNYKSY